LLVNCLWRLMQLKPDCYNQWKRIGVDAGGQRGKRGAAFYAVAGGPVERAERGWFNHACRLADSAIASKSERDHNRTLLVHPASCFRVEPCLLYPGQDL
jgi:hypothetical protein